MHTASHRTRTLLLLGVFTWPCVRLKSIRGFLCCLGLYPCCPQCPIIQWCCLCNMFFVLIRSLLFSQQYLKPFGALLPLAFFCLAAVWPPSTWSVWMWSVHSPIPVCGLALVLDHVGEHSLWGGYLMCDSNSSNEFYFAISFHSSVEHTDIFPVEIFSKSVNWRSAKAIDMNTKYRYVWKRHVWSSQRHTKHNPKAISENNPSQWW